MYSCRSTGSILPCRLSTRAPPARTRVNPTLTLVCVYFDPNPDPDPRVWVYTRTAAAVLEASSLAGCPLAPLLRELGSILP